MSKEKRQRAQDLMQRWQQDPDIQRHLSERNARREAAHKRIEEDGKALVAELRLAGCHLSLNEMVNSDVKLSDEVVEILLRHLNRCTDNRNRDMIIRALIGAVNPFDGTELAKCFDETKDSEGVRWSVLNTISSTTVIGIGDWIDRLCENPYRKEELRKLGYRRRRRR